MENPETQQTELSNSTRQLILLEERYRQEVARSLAPAGGDTLRGRSLKFLNSAFGLWLLSAILVTGLGSQYTRWRANAEASKLRAARVEQLDLEIAYRLSRVLQGSKEMASLIEEHDLLVAKLEADTRARHYMKDFPGTDFEGDIAKEQRQEIEAQIASLKKEILEVDHPLVLLSRSTSERFPPLYSEFASMNMRTLLVELRRAVQPARRPSIDNVLDRMSRPPLDVMLARRTRQADLLCLLSRRVLNELVLPEWRQLPFRNLSCPKDSPWCEWLSTQDGKEERFDDQSCAPTS